MFIPGGVLGVGKSLLQGIGFLLMDRLAQGVVAIAGATVLAVQVIVGFLVVSMGQVYRSRLANLTSTEIPSFTKLVFNHTSGILPIVIGVIIGVASAVLLVFAMREDRNRGYIPILLCLFFAIAIIHTVTVWLGASLPTHPTSG